MKDYVVEKILPQSSGLGRPLLRAGRLGELRDLFQKILAQLKSDDVRCLKRRLQKLADLRRLCLRAGKAGKKNQGDRALQGFHSSTTLRRNIAARTAGSEGLQRW